MRRRQLRLQSGLPNRDHSTILTYDAYDQLRA
jgi:hypothetical protein